MKKPQPKPRGRPPKKASERKSVDLRIPVTGAQKATIHQAVERTGEDFAAWARAILLSEAGKLLDEAG
jgi:hypothetical protein